MAATRFTLGDIARRVNAHIRPAFTNDTDAALIAQHPVTGLASLEHATVHQVAFLSNPRYKSQLACCQAGAVLIAAGDMPAANAEGTQQTAGYRGVYLIVDNPYVAYAILTPLFDQTPRPPAGIHPTACIADSACIDPTASIGAYVVIEADASIGAHSIIESHSVIGAATQIGAHCWIDKQVTIQHHCVLGKRVRVHAGSVIGGDGFGFAPYQGKWHRIAQLGRVVIGSDVRIGGNCAIDRGALDDTEIGDGVIIDNLVQIAHNVKIGEHTAIAANVGIAGSTRIGKHCIIGGASGIAGHLSIGDHVQLTGMSMITKSIHEPGTYSSGTAFAPNSQWKKMVVRLRQLADVPLLQRLTQIEHLQARLEQVESRLKAHSSSLGQDD